MPLSPDWTRERAALEHTDTRLRDVVFGALKTADVSDDDGRAILERWDATRPTYGTPTIEIIVPVLGRPRNARPLVKSAAATTTTPYRLTFVCSPEDRQQIAACVATKTARVLVASWPSGSGDFARKINLGYRESTAPFIFQAADDVVFEPGWDVAVLAVAIDTGAGVIGTNDLGNDKVMRGEHATHSLIRRAYIDHPGASLDGPGYAFHEGYGHQWCDTELVELAKARGQWAFADTSHVRHRHPFWDRTVPRDATYTKGQSTTGRDRSLYQTRSQQWIRKPR